MAELAALNIRRGQLKANITRLAKYIKNNSNEEIDIDQIRLRAEKARDTWDDFQQVQAQIEELDNTDEANEKYRSEFEDMYFENMAKCEKLMKISINNCESNEPPNSVCTSINHDQSRENIIQPINSAVKLVALQIPNFSGLYSEWASFFDIFTALVHKNESLSDIQKFFYLRSSLSGDAERAIKCLQTTAINYMKAWDTLIARYDNKKSQIQVHTQLLYDLEPIKRESSIQLRQLIDAIKGNLSALESLGQNPDQWGSLLLYLIMSKLDTNTLREWERASSNTIIPDAQELLDFLQSHCRILESIESSKQINASHENNRKQWLTTKKSTTRTGVFAAIGEIKCFLCKQPHTIYRCPSFLNLSISDRIKKTNELKLCKICLRIHENNICNSRRCPICARPHNGLLHLPRSDKSKSQPVVMSTEVDNNIVNTKDSAEPSVSVNAHVYRKNNSKQILLSTATVLVYDKDHKPILCRVLLDCGSQHNFITENMAQYLRLKRTKTSCAVIGINESSHTASSLVSTTIKSRTTNYSLILDLFVLPRLTTKIPLMPVNISNLKLPTDLALADPGFGTPQSVDILLGAEVFFDLMMSDQIRPITQGPVLQNTKFGWIVAGSVPHTFDNSDKSNVSLCTYASSEKETLEDRIAAFWRLEELKPDETYTIEERLCKQHFENNVQRGEDGRFIVVLPFRNEHKLGNSYDMALRRFMTLERRLQSDNNLKLEYTKFMKEYIELGHMELSQTVIPRDRCYYLPHHAVHKESSTTTKLRVVFDASAKTDTNVSLNDILLKGPCIQQELVSIMLRFRTHKYVITADIKKMYRQIWIAKHQHDYQRILWREKPDQPINTYCLKTVTYGVITSPYLATACLKSLSEEEIQKYPEACRALRQDFYVDDFLGGASSISETIKLRDNLITILQNAGFELCKWSSNEPSLLPNDAASKTCNDDAINNNNNRITKILGMYWNQDNDAFQYKVQSYDNNVRITKRVILSEIASVFDPLGLISPVIIKFKIIMQRLWQLKTDWDSSLPSDIEIEWRKIRENIIQLNSLTIPRSVSGPGEILNIELHGFADASTNAYGACVYLRVTNTNGTHITTLLCAKSRVAPLKTVSIPRLELLAAVLLVRLVSKYVTSLQLTITKRYYWSDSTIVLAWISSQSSRWKTFVANRIGEIHEKTTINQWAHVRTHDNPADIVSRGCCSSQIKYIKLWWNGPEWLSRDYVDWPEQNMDLTKNDEVAIEEKSVSNVTSVIKYDLSFIDRYSSLSKLIRVISYCRRFANNTSSKNIKIYGSIQAVEYHETTMCIIKLIQASNFQREILDLKSAQPVHSKSALIRLKPFLDENGLVRVGGRLKHAATIDIFQRHPIVLPAKCSFTKLIFSNEHEVLLHGGPQVMLTSVRLKYWPLNGRNIARMVARRCVKCFKYRPVVMQPIMGDLPRSRVEPVRAFKRTGIDFAGPFYVKTHLRRNAIKNKVYVCIWVCLVTKAVHMELVGDLTTQSFLNALQRFCSRRGLCTDIYSDNATNFVGANRQLQELKTLILSKEHQTQVQNELSKIGIQWHFIPPRSPHFGGLWEAAVKSFKSHLYKSLGNATLTYEELNTLLVRIEAILNSRPLTALSSDPSDMSALTPGHFLIGESLLALPERDETTTSSNNLSRWKRVSQMAQHFWSRWSRDYLSQLQERNKWSNSTGPRCEIGSIVLIRDDNLPPLQWSIGRITNTIQGSDGQVRVATVKTVRGDFKRAVRCLCPLPFEGNQSQ